MNTTLTKTQAVGEMLLEQLLEQVRRIGHARSAKEAAVVEAELRAIGTAARAANHLKTTLGDLDNPDTRGDAEFQAERERTAERVRQHLQTIWNDLDRRRKRAFEAQWVDVEADDTETGEASITVRPSPSP